MVAIETRDILAYLAGALHELASATTDSYVASAARRYAAILTGPATGQMEALVRQVRDDLSNHKTSFNDSFDESQGVEQARQKACTQAQDAVNYFVGLRRPDLAAVVGTGRKA